MSHLNITLLTFKQPKFAIANAQDKNHR